MAILFGETNLQLIRLLERQSSINDFKFFMDNNPLWINITSIFVIFHVTLI